MAVSKLIIGGFKSIRDRTEIPIAPVTFLFGPNSAGKSAVLAAVDVLSEMLLSPQERASFCVSGEEDRHLYPNGLGWHIHTRGARTYGDGIDMLPFTFGIEYVNTLKDRIQWDGIRDDAYAMVSAMERQLDDERLCIEISDDNVSHGSTVEVHGERLVAFSAYWCDPGGDWPGEGAKPEPEDPIFGLLGGAPLVAGHWGTLTLSLAHPLWRQSELFKHFQALTTLVQATNSASVAQAIRVDGDTLVIRTPMSMFRAFGWGQDTYDLGAMRSLQDVVRHGTAGEGPALTAARMALAPLMREVDLVCSTVSILVFGIRSFAMDELRRLTRVPGDRRKLEKADLTCTSDMGHFDAEYDDGSISRYARWLGLSHGGEDVLSDAEMDKVRARSDLVNVALRALFPERGYQVMPEVALVTNESLVARNGHGWDHKELRVSLYLKDANGRDLDFSNVGSGVSYVMPVLTALWGAYRSWIEQPELHLHPAAQCELGDVVLRAFHRGHFSIIETHSEHMLLRVLRRIRQAANGQPLDPELRCVPEAISVLYFEPLSDGSTKIRPLRVSRTGDFMDRWPQGFFAERDRELFDE